MSAVDKRPAPNVRDMPKLKTQLPDPLMVISFTTDDFGYVIIELRYMSNTPAPETPPIYRGRVYQPESLRTGLDAAVERARG